MTDKSAAAVREFVQNWRADLMMHEGANYMISDLTALISEHYYPKEFVEWVFREGIGSNDDGTLFHYVSIQIKGHPFKETKELTFNTIDELYQYWKENVR
jgi:hypothetical protein